MAMEESTQAVEELRQRLLELNTMLDSSIDELEAAQTNLGEAFEGMNDSMENIKTHLEEIGNHAEEGIERLESDENEVNTLLQGVTEVVQTSNSSVDESVESLDELSQTVRNDLDSDLEEMDQIAEGTSGSFDEIIQVAENERHTLNETGTAALASFTETDTAIEGLRQQMEAERPEIVQGFAQTTTRLSSEHLSTANDLFTGFSQELTGTHADRLGRSVSDLHEGLGTIFNVFDETVEDQANQYIDHTQKSIREMAQTIEQDSVSKFEQLHPDVDKVMEDSHMNFDDAIAKLGKADPVVSDYQTHMGDDDELHHHTAIDT